MELVKDEIQPYEKKLALLPFYENGMCHECNSPVEYHNEILAITIQDTQKWTVFAPLTLLKCPWCKCRMKSILIWKDLDITKELAELGKEK